MFAVWPRRCVSVCNVEVERLWSYLVCHCLTWMEVYLFFLSLCCCSGLFCLWSLVRPCGLRTFFCVHDTTKITINTATTPDGGHTFCFPHMHGREPNLYRWNLFILGHHICFTAFTCLGHFHFYKQILHLHTESVGKISCVGGVLVSVCSPGCIVHFCFCRH